MHYYFIAIILQCLVYIYSIVSDKKTCYVTFITTLEHKKKKNT